MTKRKRKQSAPAKSDDHPTAIDPRPSGAPEADKGDHQADANVLAENNNASLLPPLSRILSVVMLILGIVVIGGLFLKVMAGFFIPLFLAALLVVIFRPVNRWFFRKTGQRPRLAALFTTGLILLMVLVPVVALISVATSQFTSILTHVKNFEDLSGTFDRARSKLGIALEHPQQFRRLDELLDTLDESKDPTTGEPVSANRDQIIKKIDEASDLVGFLHENVKGPSYSDPDADKAIEMLSLYREAVENHLGNEDRDLIAKVDAKDQFDLQSVIAVAAIRTWMRSKLGGTFRSQILFDRKSKRRGLASMAAKGA